MDRIEFLIQSRDFFLFEKRGARGIEQQEARLFLAWKGDENGQTAQRYFSLYRERTWMVNGRKAMSEQRAYKLAV